MKRKGLKGRHTKTIAPSQLLVPFIDVSALRAFEGVVGLLPVVITTG